VKRSPLRRTKGLARGGRLGRNPKRRRKLRTYQHGTTERTRWFREQPCVCQGQHPACTGGWSEPSHVVSRGAGGTASDIVPMSRGCHQAWHDHGQLTWCARSGLSPLECEASECQHCMGTRYLNPWRRWFHDPDEVLTAARRMCSHGGRAYVDQVATKACIVVSWRLVGDNRCGACLGTGLSLPSILAALRHLARTHYATQGPDAPGDQT
jgi:hypothetical protein